MVKVLALITARGGSKGIPRKNVLPIGGKPLIAWTIDAALGSKYLSRTVVSTDDEEIARVAKACGADVPFLRPASLAQDASPHIPVLLHALEFLESSERESFDYILLLQPTSPFRITEDIDKSIELALDKNGDSVVSVCEACAHPYLAKRISADGLLEAFMPAPEGYLSRQTLPPAFMLNGAIYLVRRDTLVGERTFYPQRTFAYVMPVERSLDIDTAWDWHVAELIFQAKIDTGTNKPAGGAP